MATQSEKTKLAIVVIVLAVLLTGIYFLRKDRQKKLSESFSPPVEKTMLMETEKEDDNVITVSSSGFEFEPGDVIPVEISFQAPGKNIFGSDIILLYDPQYLSTDETSVSPGGFFASIPRVLVDGENGIIKLTAIEGADRVLQDEEVNIATVNFTAVAEGRTSINLSFTRGETNTTTLTERTTSLNILQNFRGFDLTIEE